MKNPLQKVRAGNRLKLFQRQSPNSKICQKFYNQNFENLFHSFFCILAHRSWRQVLWESEKNFRRTSDLKTVWRHTSTVTDRYIHHLYYKHRCRQASSGPKHQLYFNRDAFLKLTRGQSNLTKSPSRGAHSPVRGHPRGRNLYHWIPGVGFPISVP